MGDKSLMDLRSYYENGVGYCTFEMDESEIEDIGYWIEEAESSKEKEIILELNPFNL